MNRRSGQLSVSVLFFATLSVVLLTGFVFLASSLLQLSLRSLNRSQAFAIAEAGIEYYRWHLAHAPEDFQDGTGEEGPYEHPYYDKNGTEIGSFTLTITPPPAGSTVVTVRSQGEVLADESISKVIEVKLAIPSFAKYAWALNDVVVFGTAAEVFGPVHSNNGIKFNGLAHNLVTSALTTYSDPDTWNTTRWAVNTTVSPSDPLPPTEYSARPDVFEAGREISVPALDFTKLTQDLADLKTAASSTGFYFASSTDEGWELVFATSGVYEVYRVDRLETVPGSCSSGQSGWGTWSVDDSTLVATGTIPDNGTMFFEDHLWVRGQIDGKRVTVASGRFPDNPSTRSSITVNSDLLYTNYDGTDVIALVAQDDLNIGLFSEDDLRIDAAIIAMNGRIGRYSYSSSQCGSTRSRDLLTTYGMLGTAQRAGFVYSSSNGYQARQYIYDANLLYGPPPNFPLTTDQYTQISWDEVQ